MQTYTIAGKTVKSEKLTTLDIRLIEYCITCKCLTASSKSKHCNIETGVITSGQYKTYKETKFTIED